MSTWKRNHGLAKGGVNLNNTFSTVEEGKTRCEANPECVGFNMYYESRTYNGATAYGYKPHYMFKENPNPLVQSVTYKNHETNPNRLLRTAGVGFGGRVNPTSELEAPWIPDYGYTELRYNIDTSRTDLVNYIISRPVDSTWDFDAPLRFLPQGRDKIPIYYIAGTQERTLQLANDKPPQPRFGWTDASHPRQLAAYRAWIKYEKERKAWRIHEIGLISYLKEAEDERKRIQDIEALYKQQQYDAVEAQRAAIALYEKVNLENLELAEAKKNPLYEYNFNTNIINTRQTNLNNRTEITCDSTELPDDYEFNTRELIQNAFEKCECSMNKNDKIVRDNADKILISETKQLIWGELKLYKYNGTIIRDIPIWHRPTAPARTNTVTDGKFEVNGVLRTWDPQQFIKYKPYTEPARVEKILLYNESKTVQDVLSGNVAIITIDGQRFWTSQSHDYGIDASNDCRNLGQSDSHDGKYKNIPGIKYDETKYTKTDTDAFFDPWPRKTYTCKKTEAYKNHLVDFFKSLEPAKNILRPIPNAAQTIAPSDLVCQICPNIAKVEDATLIRSTVNIDQLASCVNERTEIIVASEEAAQLASDKLAQDAAATAARQAEASAESARIEQEQLDKLAITEQEEIDANAVSDAVVESEQTQQTFGDIPDDIPETTSNMWDDPNQTYSPEEAAAAADKAKTPEEIEKENEKFKRNVMIGAGVVMVGIIIFYSLKNKD
ncbi:MAG: hypothetical protein N2B06_02395 [Clostridium sp.]